MPGKTALNRFTEQRGFTLVELLVSLLVAATLALGAIKLYSNAVKLGLDQKIRTEALVKAQAAVQMIGSEIRVLGNGVPFDQSNFRFVTSPSGTLTDTTVALPLILSDLSTTNISFRLNESGEVKLLTQDYDPATNTDIFLTEVDRLQVNDPVYINNGVVGGSDGFYGVISSINTAQKSVTFAAASRQYNSPTAKFKMGSIFEVTPVVTWNSKGDGSGITRNSGYGETVVADKSTFQLQFLTDTGTQIALPISADQLRDEVRAIRVTVTTTHPTPLSNGQSYSISVPHTFAIRNLNILY